MRIAKSQISLSVRAAGSGSLLLFAYTILVSLFTEESTGEYDGRN